VSNAQPHTHQLKTPIADKEDRPPFYFLLRSSDRRADSRTDRPPDRAPQIRQEVDHTSWEPDIVEGNHGDTCFVDNDVYFLVSVTTWLELRGANDVRGGDGGEGRGGGVVTDRLSESTLLSWATAQHD